MNIIDNDLLSIQEARILVENAREAQKKTVVLSQEKIDEIVEKMLDEIDKNLESLSRESSEETRQGNWKDKLIKDKYINDSLRNKLKDMKCVGLIENDKINKVLSVGVPLGVIVAFCSTISPVSTIVYKAILAIKSGNTIVFSRHLKAKNIMKKTLDILIKAGEEAGLPEGALSYLENLSFNGSKELIHHRDTSLILNTGVKELLEEMQKSGKQVIYGTIGNAPVFIEKTANIQKAVRDVVISKSFDYGIMPGAEHSIVVDGCIEKEVKCELEINGAYFMKESETENLMKILFDKHGEIEKECMGKSPQWLSQKANFKIDKDIKLLIITPKYISKESLYSKEKLCPVISFYVEPDWQNACEKCIELLLSGKQGHTLIIHSKDEDVINQFIMKKPVGRILVNTPGAFGSIGGTTNLFPAMTLGSGLVGNGITSDNISPMNLIYIRKVGYEVRDVDEFLKKYSSENNLECDVKNKFGEESIDLEALIKKILKEISEKN